MSTASAPYRPVVFLMGPTAVGKTELAFKLCDEFPFEIISVDSALVYRRLDIGSAKPTPAMLRRHVHHLVNIREPHEAYSAAEFRLDALKQIDEIHRRRKIPLLVGGTGLYFRTLEQGIADLPDASADIRNGLHEDCELHGSQKMHLRLAEIDPQSALRIHENDPQRILRALEIHAITGKTMTQFLAEQQRTPMPFDSLKIVYAPSQREELHRRIATRFEQMLVEGFINEVAALKQDSRLSANNPALRAVGYRAVWQFLDGNIELSQMTNDAVVATRRLAKRQFTWFRSESSAQWVDSLDSSALEHIITLINDKTFAKQIDYN